MSNKTICSACGAEFDVNLRVCPECGSGDRAVDIPESAKFGDNSDEKIELAETSSMIETLMIVSRSYMSVQFLLAASLYCRESWKIEIEVNKDLASADRYFSIGAVMLSFSAIESSINEFYQDIADSINRESLNKILSYDKTQALLNYWQKAKKSPDTEKKFQEVLKILEQPVFSDDKDTSNEPYERFKVLKKMRHALYHYSPETSNKLQRHNEIEQSFEKHSLSVNPFFDSPANTFFPDKCFGHGLAEWSINTAIDFIDSFYDRLNAPSRLDAHRKDFRTRE